MEDRKIHGRLSGFAFRSECQASFAQVALLSNGTSTSARASLEPDWRNMEDVGWILSRVVDLEIDIWID